MERGKEAKTIRERGIAFDYAITVFLDPGRIEEFSRRDERGEDRFLTIGRTPADEILFVAYVWRVTENEKICRIVSARKASPKERKRYRALH